MKKYLLALVFICMGALSGGAIVWVDSYSDANLYLAVPPQAEVQLAIANILNYSTVAISPENLCPDGDQATVGAVISTMLAQNIASKRNRMAFACINKSCSLAFSSCNPWSQECGSKFLVYDLTADDKVDPSTFRCMYVP